MKLKGHPKKKTPQKKKKDAEKKDGGEHLSKNMKDEGKGAEKDVFHDEWC